MGSRVRSGIVCQCGRVCGVSVSGVERQGEGNLEATVTAFGLSIKYRDRLVPRDVAGHMLQTEDIIYILYCT
jgi:hypothetical protein